MWGRRGNRTVVAMTITEYALNIALAGLVLLQVRGITVTKAALVFPVVMTAWIATSLLKMIPTGGNDLVLRGARPGTGQDPPRRRRVAARRNGRDVDRAAAGRATHIGANVALDKRHRVDEQHRPRPLPQREELAIRESVSYTH